MIRGISNYDVNFMYSKSLQSNKSAAENNNSKQKRKSTAIAATVGSAAAIIAIGGGSVYYLNSIRRNKMPKRPKPILPTAQPVPASTKTENVDKWMGNLQEKNKKTGIMNYIGFDKFKFLKHVRSNGYIPLDAYMKDGWERLTYVTKANGLKSTIQDFLTPSKKIHERNIYRKDLIVRYDYAYDEKGKPIGFAREVIQEGDKNYPSQMTVKMYEPNRDIKSKYIDDLYEEVPEFAPKNIK